MLHAFSRPPLKVVLWIGGGMVFIVVLHIGGVFALRVGQFSPLTGALFALAWYLLLGTLSQAPGEVSLAKFLGLYYPAGDTVLLSCIVFLLLRGQQGRVYQATARRVSLLVVGLGVCFFVASDFLFN